MELETMNNGAQRTIKQYVFVLMAVFAFTLIVGCSSTDEPAAPMMYHVSGKVTSVLATNKTQGVTITLGTMSAVTDANSEYTIDSVVAGTYTVTPVLAGRVFTPPNTSVTVSNTDVTGIDFILEPTSGVLPDSIQMELIAAGTFMMGNEAGVPESDSLAVPRHQVTLSQSLYVGIHEVTQAQWMKVMGVNPSITKGNNVPVTNIASDSIITFCNKMSVLHGLQPVYTGNGSSVSINYNANGYRLLTEAEWEYAAAAGDEGLYYDAVDPTPGMTHFDSVRITVKLNEYACWAGSLGGTAVALPQPVGTRVPNAWGLYDCIGNVFEIVEDELAPYSAGAATDPVVIPDQNVRTIRGGSYKQIEWKFFSLRKRLSGGFGNDGNAEVGFRIARR